MDKYILRTTGLTKQYGKQKALDNININVKEGAIYGLIGKNGAGKTTLMKLVTGLANPTEGEIKLFENGQMRIGSLIENPGAYGDMNAFDNMKLKAIEMGVYRKENITELLELVGLDKAGNKHIKKYSMGMKQRLGIAMALLGGPDFLILDEPINGLDPEGIIEIRDLIKKLNQTKHITFLISSHILEELSKLATDYGIIDRGVLITEISSEKLHEKCGKRIEIVSEDPSAVTVILDKLGIRNYSVLDNETIHVSEQLDRIQEINSELMKNNIMISSIGVHNENLEEFFLRMTERKTK